MQMPKRQVSQAAIAVSSGPAFLSLIVKAIFNTHSKYQPNGLLGRSVFPCKWSLSLCHGPATAGWLYSMTMEITAGQDMVLYI